MVEAAGLRMDAAEVDQRPAEVGARTGAPRCEFGGQPRQRQLRPALALGEPPLLEVRRAEVDEHARMVERGGFKAGRAEAGVRRFEMGQAPGMLALHAIGRAERGQRAQPQQRAGLAFEAGPIRRAQRGQQVLVGRCEAALQCAQPAQFVVRTGLRQRVRGAVARGRRRRQHGGQPCFDAVDAAAIELDRAGQRDQLGTRRIAGQQQRAVDGRRGGVEPAGAAQLPRAPGELAQARISARISARHRRPP